MGLGSGAAGRSAAGALFGAPPAGEAIQERLMAQRVVVVDRDIDDDLANAVCTALVLLEGDDPRRDITLLVNSPGGTPEAALAIYDTMQWIAPDVATVVHGIARSVAQLLVTAGAPGKRTALPHARLVTSRPRPGGEPGDARTRSEELTRRRDEIVELVALHSGRSVEQAQADAERERWFTATEAVEYGLVDRVAARD